MVPARLNPSKPTRLLLLCRVTVLCLVSVPLQAQTRVDTWTADNGLPQNSVTALTQMPDGYIWLTTQEGLVGRSTERRRNWETMDHPHRLEANPNESYGGRSNYSCAPVRRCAAIRRAARRSTTGRVQASSAHWRSLPREGGQLEVRPA